MIDKIIKYKYIALFVPVLLILLLAFGAKNLVFTNDYHMFFSDDNPQLLAFDNLQDTYNKTDNVIIGLRDVNGIFTKKNLEIIANITEQAWQTPFSSRVDSLSNYQHTSSNEDDLEVINLIDLEFGVIDEKKIERIAINEILLNNRLITKNKDTTGINITVQLPRDEQEATEAQTAVVKFVRELRDSIKQQYPNFEVYLSGIIMLNQAFPEAGQKDISTLIPMSFLIVFILLLVVLRNFVLVLGSILTLIFTILGSFGVAGHLGIAVTPPMISMPVIILTIAVAGSVHMMISFVKEMGSGASKKTAVISAYTHNYKAIIIAGITTAIGFFGLNFSEVPPFHDLGNIAAVGTLLSLLLILVFLPAWMLVMPIKIKRKTENEDNLIANFADFVIRKKNTILVLSLLVMVFFISFIPKNEINDNFVEYFDNRVEFRRDADNVNKYLTGIGGIDYSFDSKVAGGISNTKFLKDVAKFVSWARSQPEVNNVSSITDTLKSLNKNMHGDKDGFYSLPLSHNLGAQYLLLYEMSLPYGLDLNNQINIDKSTIRVSVNAKNLSSNGYIELEKRAEKWLKDNTPDILTQGASPSIMFAHIGSRNVIAMIYGTTITLVIISILLMFFLGSFKIGLISLVPNLIPASMAFGLWAIVDGEITMALSVVASITLGIIVDDTVHFLTQYSYALKKLGKSAEDSVRYAFKNVGKALILSSLALSGGFFVLANSVFKINSAMGELTAYIIIIALIMDFLLLPTLLLVFEKSKVKK